MNEQPKDKENFDRWLESSPSYKAIKENDLLYAHCFTSYLQGIASRGAHEMSLSEALSAYLRAPIAGSDYPGSLTVVVQDFNRRDAVAALNAWKESR